MAFLIAAVLALSVPRAAMPGGQEVSRHPVPEHDVKAAYLYNFARFVTWPPDVSATKEPFRVCVVADTIMT